MRRWLALFILLVLGVSICPAVWAESQAAVRYELYSWKDGNDWNFSLLPMEKNRRVDAEIKHVGGPLRGAGKIKEKILKMNEGDKISWRERAESGLVYPPKPVVDEIRDYAMSVGVTLSAPR